MKQIVEQPLFLPCIALIIVLASLGFWHFGNSGYRPSESAQASEEVGEHTVELTERGYQPREITITVGETVTFSASTGRPHWPASNVHPTHTIYSAFDPKRPLAPDESWSFTFEKAGEWGLHDHLRAHYTGTIYVVE